VGDDELRIVASQDIGQLGPKDGSPVAFHWRWYYSVPTLPLWALIVLLLVVPKANRHRQAWLILVPLGVVLLVWRMPMALFSMPDGPTETIGFFVGSVAMAWSTVWLVGHWLGGRSRKVAFFLILAAMTAIGLLSYWCHYADTDGLVLSMIGFDLVAVVLPLAMLWTSYSCRKNCTPGRFRGRLLVRMMVPLMVLMLSYVPASMLVRFPGPGNLAILAPMLLTMLIASLVCAGILYLLNLPFLELAFRSSFYADRFERIFHIEKDRVEFNKSSEPQVV